MTMNNILPGPRPVGPSYSNVTTTSQIPVVTIVPPAPAAMATPQAAASQYYIPQAGFKFA